MLSISSIYSVFFKWDSNTEYTVIKNTAINNYLIGLNIVLFGNNYRYKDNTHI